MSLNRVKSAMQTSYVNCIADLLNVTDTVVNVHNYHSGLEGGGGELYPEFACRAFAKFNGVTGISDIEKGVTVTKTSTGQYKATFDTPLPDSNYSAVLSLGIANLGDQVEIASQLASELNFVVRDNAGVFHDSPLINLSVFR